MSVHIENVSNVLRIVIEGIQELDEITPDSEIQVVPEGLNSKPQSTQLKKKILEIETMGREIAALKTGAHS